MHDSYKHQVFVHVAHNVTNAQVFYVLESVGDNRTYETPGNGFRDRDGKFWFLAHTFHNTNSQADSAVRDEQDDSFSIVTRV